MGQPSKPGCWSREACRRSPSSLESEVFGVTPDELLSFFGSEQLSHPGAGPADGLPVASTDMRAEGLGQIWRKGSFIVVRMRLHVAEPIGAIGSAACVPEWRSAQRAAAGTGRRSAANYPKHRHLVLLTLALMRLLVDRWSCYRRDGSDESCKGFRSLAVKISPRPLQGPASIAEHDVAP